MLPTRRDDVVRLLEPAAAPYGYSFASTHGQLRRRAPGVVHEIRLNIGTYAEYIHIAVECGTRINDVETLYWLPIAGSLRNARKKSASSTIMRGQIFSAMSRDPLLADVIVPFQAAVETLAVPFHSRYCTASDVDEAYSAVLSGQFVEITGCAKIVGPRHVACKYLMGDRPGAESVATAWSSWDRTDADPEMLMRMRFLLEHWDRDLLKE